MESLAAAAVTPGRACRKNHHPLSTSLNSENGIGSMESRYTAPS